MVGNSMKTDICLLYTSFLITMCAASLQAGVVTITVLNGASPPGGSNAVEVKAGETAEVKFTYDSSAGPGVSGQLYLEITQDNLTFTINGDKLTPGFYSNGPDSRGNPMIAGPAFIK